MRRTYYINVLLYFFILIFSLLITVSFGLLLFRLLCLVLDVFLHLFVSNRSVPFDISKGRAEGMAKGRTNELLKLAKKMTKDNLDIELIKRYTGYSTKQIEELKKSMS